MEIQNPGAEAFSVCRDGVAEVYLSLCTGGLMLVGEGGLVADKGTSGLGWVGKGGNMDQLYAL